MRTLWREQNLHTFEDVENSVTSLQSLFIRAYSTSVMCGDFTNNNSIVDCKESLYFFAIYLFFWISKCETLLGTEREKWCIHYTKEVYRGCELKSAKSS